MNNSKIRTFKKRFYLDQVFTRSTTETTNHWVGSTIKAFMVVGTNNENFDLSIVADPDMGGSIEGLSVGDVRVHNYTHIANDAVLENKVPQVGVWVDIQFSVEDEFIYSGGRKTDQSRVVITDGSNHSSRRIHVNSGGVELFPASDERSKGSIQHKSGGSIWLGNPNELTDPYFKEICHELKEGEVLVWKNRGSLHAIADSEDAILSCFEETI